MNDRKSPVVLIVVLLIIVFVAVFCYTQLEIVPATRWVAPSREVRANPLCALEEWLEASGRSVRTLSAGTSDILFNVPEKIIFIENSCFKWYNNMELLIPWLEEGRQLIISLDSNVQYQLEDFMESLGITTDPPDNFFDEDDKTDASLIISEEEQDKPKEKTPNFDLGVSFFKTDPETPLKYKAFVMNSHGRTRLVKFEIGKGALIFIGEAEFLTNNALREKPNVDLAAEIFLADLSLGENGILFFRSLGNERHLIGNLAERGNPAAIYTSLILLVIAGFWMAIPVFGRYKPAPEKPGKPLHERFLAEGRFLKKNHALGKYIETYEKELEQRSRSKAEVFIPRATDSSVKEITFGQFLNEQKELMEKLERINKERQLQN